jgi:hypothetical protein
MAIRFEFARWDFEAGRGDTERMAYCRPRYSVGHWEMPLLRWVPKVATHPVERIKSNGDHRHAATP